MQVVFPTPGPGIAIADLSHVPANEREQVAFQRISDDVNQSFDSQNGPLLRVTLLRLAEDEHILSINMHHIVRTGGRWVSSFTSWPSVYNSFVAGQPCPLRDLNVQYSDYASSAAAMAEGKRPCRSRSAIGRSNFGARRLCWTWVPAGLLRRLRAFKAVESHSFCRLH